MQPNIEDFIRPRRSVNNGWTNSYYGNINLSTSISNQHFFEPDKHFGKSLLKVEKFHYPSNEKATMNTNSSLTPVKGMLSKSYLDQSQKSLMLQYLREDMAQYFEKTSLHGLRYVGDATTSIPEKIFWITAFLSAIAFSAYFISNIYERWNLSPVIISLNPKAIPLSDIPFPAITICNMNQANKDEALKINVSGSEIERSILDDFCDSNYTVQNTSNTNNFAAWDSLKKFMIRVGQPCSDMAKVCKWHLEDVDCNSIFRRTLTDEGFCCTFNTLPKNYIFKNYKDMFTSDDSIKNDTVIDWSPEKGFPENTPFEAIPRRPLGAGAHMGLTLVLDADVDSYYCSSTSSVGFKAMMHNPAETPKMADFGFIIAPAQEMRINIIPKISDASNGIKGVSVDKRQCYFSHEKSMAYYRSYTQRNCKLECQANYTLQQCGCVPYFLPMNETTRICGKRQELCSNQAKAVMEMPYSYSSNRTDCKCLPGCFEISYQKSHSSSSFSSSVKIRDAFLRNDDPEYFRKNMALVHFYFIDGQFTKFTKSEIYGFTEFLSNTGGLLGLFLGFSFLSAVEIFYYLTIKMFCTYKNRFRQNQNESAIPFTK